MLFRSSSSVFLAALSIAVTGVFASKAEAGAGSGGGGIAFKCRAGLLGEHDYFLADIYSLIRSDIDRLRKEDVSEKDVLEAIFGTIEFSDPNEASDLRKNLESLQFVPGGPLSLLGDDDIGNPPKGCKKVQLAVQHFDTNTVNYDESMFNRISTPERAFLKLHEAYIKKYKANTADVRDHVLKEFTNKTFRNVLKHIISASHSTYWFQFSPVEVNAKNGAIPAEYLEYAKTLVGTYTGKISYGPDGYWGCQEYVGRINKNLCQRARESEGTLTIKLDGDRYTLSFRDKDGIEDITGHSECQSRVGDFLGGPLSYSDKNSGKHLHFYEALFSFDPGNCTSKRHSDIDLIIYADDDLKTIRIESNAVNDVGGYFSGTLVRQQ